MSFTLYIYGCVRAIDSPIFFSMFLMCGQTSRLFSVVSVERAFFSLSLSMRMSFDNFNWWCLLLLPMTANTTEQRWNKLLNASARWNEYVMQKRGQMGEMIIIIPMFLIINIILAHVFLDGVREKSICLIGG